MTASRISLTRRAFVAGVFAVAAMATTLGSFLTHPIPVLFAGPIPYAAIPVATICGFLLASLAVAGGRSRWSTFLTAFLWLPIYALALVVATMSPLLIEYWARRPMDLNAAFEGTGMLLYFGFSCSYGPAVLLGIPVMVYGLRYVDRRLANTGALRPRRRPRLDLEKLNSLRSAHTGRAIG